MSDTSSANSPVPSPYEVGSATSAGSLVAEEGGFKSARLRTLLAVMFCYLFYYTGRQTFGFAIPGMMKELGLTKAQMGWCGAAMLWCLRHWDRPSMGSSPTALEASG
ncbi:MAG: hypothetical protein QM755_09485 [Luteolibacter sp.]